MSENSRGPLRLGCPSGVIQQPGPGRPAPVHPTPSQAPSEDGNRERLRFQLSPASGLLPIDVAPPLAVAPPPPSLDASGAPAARSDYVSSALPRWSFGPGIAWSLVAFTCGLGLNAGGGGSLTTRGRLYTPRGIWRETKSFRKSFALGAKPGRPTEAPSSVTTAAPADEAEFPHGVASCVRSQHSEANTLAAPTSPAASSGVWYSGVWPRSSAGPRQDPASPGPRDHFDRDKKNYSIAHCSESGHSVTDVARHPAAIHRRVLRYATLCLS